MVNKQTVLVVDSKKEDLDETVACLEAAGYAAIPAGDPESAVRYLFEFHPELIICAVDVGSTTGSAWVARLRELTTAPIILLASVANRRSLQVAAEMRLNGFLVKPVSPRELLGRIASVSNTAGESPLLVFRHESLTIDWRRFDVFVDDKPVHLSPTEFRLLSLLVQRRGWVVTYDEILAEVWGDEETYDRDHVKLYVWYLRRKIEREPAKPRMITTKRGIGYMFSDEQPNAVERSFDPKQKVALASRNVA